MSPPSFLHFTPIFHPLHYSHLLLIPFTSSPYVSSLPTFSFLADFIELVPLLLQRQLLLQVVDLCLCLLHIVHLGSWRVSWVDAAGSQLE